MVNHIDPVMQEPRSPRAARREPHGSPDGARYPIAAAGCLHPIINVSEVDGTMYVHADFQPVLGEPSEQVSVQFAQQGVILACGTVQRYLPIPTDALVSQARVSIAGGVARIAIPTADAGHRWRSLVMW